MYIENNDAMKKAVIVGVNINDSNFDHSMIELGELVKACNMEVVGKITQNLNEVSTALYVGKGKAEEILEYANNSNADIIIFNDELSASQLRNIQKIIDLPIMDRTALILEIFATRAKTKEAKLQVEIAKLKYMLPRLVGLHNGLGRQGSGSGISNKGSGEKKLELDKRKIEEKIVRLNRELKEIEVKRNVMRRQREKSGTMLVAMAGYTNAGKSTLMNAFIDTYSNDMDKKVEEKDMLFATLDTSVRRIVLQDNKEFLLSDTVGFISKLPHNLVKAFLSTLEEITKADLILHVIDYSDPNYKNHIEVTNTTLKQLGADKIPVIYVYNKSDLMLDTIPVTDEDSIYMSASKKIGLDQLVKMIKNKVMNDYILAKFLIPFTDGVILNDIKQKSTVLSIDYNEIGTIIEVECKESEYNKYINYLLY